MYCYWHKFCVVLLHSWGILDLLSVLDCSWIWETCWAGSAWGAPFPRHPGRAASCGGPKERSGRVASDGDGSRWANGLGGSLKRSVWGATDHMEFGGSSAIAATKKRCLGSIGFDWFSWCMHWSPGPSGGHTALAALLSCSVWAPFVSAWFLITVFKSLIPKSSPCFNPN